MDDLGVQYEERAVAAIAAAAEGGMRDALSILDQCVALGGELRYQGVVETIGTLDQSAMDRLVEDLRDGRVDRALAQVEEAYLAGKDLSLVLRDLMSAFCRPADDHCGGEEAAVGILSKSHRPIEPGGDCHAVFSAAPYRVAGGDCTDRAGEPR